jgi:hypothetical protein
MKFLFSVNKWTNFYFFVQNLSEWHFSNQKYYNQMWKKEFGSFSTKEKESLRKFKKIHLKYPFGKQYLGRPFFLRKNPWKTLEKQLSKKELTDLKNIFSIFQSKFEVIYKKDLPLLLKWQKELQKKANDKLLINPINKTLAVLYNTPLLRKKIKVYLLFSSPTVFGGKAGIDNKSIALEISRYPIKNIKSAIGAIWHEVIHACFENYYFLPLLRKSFPRDQEAIDLLQEVTVRVVFFPGGILEKKFLKISTPLSGIPKKHIQSFFKLRELVKKYIQKNKPLDKEYIGKALSLLYDLKRVMR